MNKIKLYHVKNLFDDMPKPVVVGGFRDLKQLLDAYRIDFYAVEISVNGIVACNINHPIWPGDMIHVFYRPHDRKVFKTAGLLALAAASFFVIGPAVTGALGGGKVAAFMGGLAAVATTTAGGLLINSLLSKPASNRSKSDEDQSPTYGFTQAGNNRDEGYAIPVIYGYVATNPQTINQYIEIDSGGEQWSYTLLSVHEGPTNNVPEESAILVDDQVITTIERDDYSVSATDGSASPDTSKLSDFTRLHQMRWFSKQLKGTAEGDYVSVILNFNETEGSTTITDESTWGNSWAVQGAADISTAHPWYGSGSLDLETTNSFILCNRAPSFNLINEDTFDIELRFRQDALTDSGICGQNIWTVSGSTYYQWIWALLYVSGNLVFQSWYRTGNVGAWSESTYCNYSQAVTLSIDTWHHIRVARNDADIYFWLDGTRQTKGTYSTPTAPVVSNAYQRVGYAYYWSGSGDPTPIYGNCEIDAFRISIGALLYDFDDDITPRATEAAPAATNTFTTLGMIDRFSVFIEFTNGLYKMKDDGTLNEHYVNLQIAYREVGTSSWTTTIETVIGRTQYPVRAQFDYTTVTRTDHEIRVSRITPTSVKTTKVDECKWFAVDEIIDEDLHYPYLQCVAIKLKAQDKYNTRIPSFKVISDISSITVPTLDGTSTQTKDPTNNAHAALDVLTNTVYGAGLTTSEIIDETAWDDWVDWCDGSVDGNNRCQFNMAFDSSYTLDRAIQHIENCGRARLINRGTKVSVIIEKPGSKSYIYSDGNIKTGTSKLKFLPTSERSDAVEITFKDKDLNWTDNKAFAPSSDYETLTTIPRITRISIIGINNYEQALREAILRQQISENTKRMMEFESGVEALRSVSGDIIDFQSSGNSLAAGGRIAHDANYNNEYTGTTVYLDNEVELPEATFSGNCVLVVREPDDTLIEVNITGPWDEETNRFTVDSSTTFYRFSPYIIRRSTNETYLYRITGIRRTSDQDVAVTGMEYVSESYYNANYGGGATPI